MRGHKWLIPQMARAGFAMNIVSIILITVMTIYYLPGIWALTLQRFLFGHDKKTILRNALGLNKSSRGFFMCVGPMVLSIF